MLPVRTCTAVCWREGRAWVVEVPELGRRATAARLSQVEGVARDLVHVYTSEDPGSHRVVVDLRVHSSTTELITAAADLRSSPDRVSVEAVTLRRCLARKLGDEGFDVRDVAALLGLSYGRALSLLGDHTSARRSVPALPAPRADDAVSEDVVKPHSSYRHEALLYRGAEGFLDGTLPFVEEAVELGQPVMVAVVPERLALLRSAIGEDAPVSWVDMAELGGNPARIVPAWRAFVDEHGGRPVRGIGEPVWAGRRPEEVAECQLHEALLNVAVEPDTPLWLRCPYDTDALDHDVLVEASCSHPAIVEGEDYRGSLHYGGVEHVSALFSAELPPPDGPVDERSFSAATTATVRPAVEAAADAAGLPAQRTAELALAVGEAASNSVRHGGGAGQLRVWESDGALVCEVRDAGHIDDPLVGRRAPAPDADSGRGLWLASQLSDLVQVRSGPAGTAVRVHAWLPTAPPADAGQSGTPVPSRR